MEPVIFIYTILFNVLFPIIHLTFIFGIYNTMEFVFHLHLQN